MKKLKFIVFILMILTSIPPLMVRAISWKMGHDLRNVSTIGVIGSAHGPTSIYVAAKLAPPAIFATFIPAALLFVLWLILNFKTKNNQ